MGYRRTNGIKTIYEKLRKARLKLGLSQNYVANCLGIGRSAVTQIELGNRKVNPDEITGFCKLYHISTDYMLDTENVDMDQTVPANNFNGYVSF